MLLHIFHRVGLVLWFYNDPLSKKKHQKDTTGKDKKRADQKERKWRERTGKEEDLGRGTKDKRWRWDKKKKKKRREERRKRKNQRRTERASISFQISFGNRRINEKKKKTYSSSFGFFPSFWYFKRKSFLNLYCVSNKKVTKGKTKRKDQRRRETEKKIWRFLKKNRHLNEENEKRSYDRKMKELKK